MDHIIGFLLECFALGREGKDGRNARGCLFAIVGAFAVVMLVGALTIWLLLRP